MGQAFDVEHALRRGSRSPGVRASRPISAAAVRANDIRGVAGRQVTTAGAYSLGLSYADLARAQGLSRVAVGRDGRLSSPRLETALVAGLVEGGLRVARVGLCPTPMLSFAAATLGLDGAVMVTASHNPPRENGMKLLLGDERIHGEALAALVQRRGRAAAGGQARTAGVMGAYIESLAAAAAGVRPMRVAWDCGNGATGPAVRALTARLAGAHVLLNDAVDGSFPNHHPDPAVAANLEQLGSAVRNDGCELGIAFDGDGDRIGVVDETGTPLPSDLLLLYLAVDLLRGRPGAGVVGDVKCSQLLFDGVRDLGGRPVIAPSGYVLIRQAMRRERAELAGELSGHMFFADRLNGVDDALYAAVRTLAALSRTGESLAAFRARLPAALATPELRIACPSAERIVRETAARAAPGAPFDPAMGLRKTTPDGWWLLRASGTEPKITCRCEATTPERLRALQRTVARELVASGLEAPEGWLTM
ncbi:MAG: phosphomannomutase/phosphoglucomutase [Phenylobacterium sp.]